MIMIVKFNDISDEKRACDVEDELFQEKVVKSFLIFFGLADGQRPAQPSRRRVLPMVFGLIGSSSSRKRSVETR